MKLDIIDSLDCLLRTLENSKTEESDQKTLDLYDRHIRTTVELIETLKKDGINRSLIDDFFEAEGRNYGWSYLQNENGQRAEEVFWSLKKSYFL